MPGAPQSRIVIGGVGPANSMASFFPMQVLNTVVKGRLSSDRNPTLRDFTAGVRSGFDMRKSATPFVVSTAAQADKTGESLKALLDELTGVAKGVPADELTRAKDEYTRDFPKTFEATGRISSRLRTLESLIVYGLPDDYYANYASAIQAVGAGGCSACRAAVHRSRPSHDRDRRRPEDRRARDPRVEPRIDHGDDHRRGVCAGKMTAERDHTLQKWRTV